MLIRLSQPEGLVVSLAEAKKRLRVDADVPDFDDEIEGMIRAATARYEKRTGRFMLPTDLEFRLSCWDDRVIPVAPIRSVDGVEYIDANGASIDLPTSDWSHDTDGRTLHVAFTSAPSVGAGRWPIRVRFSAGYDDPEDLGDDAGLYADPMDRQAILMLVGHWFAQRETASETPMTSVPGGFDDLVAERRIYR